MLCFSSKSGVGTPALFTTNTSGEFSYDAPYCTGFKKAGISFKAEDGFFGKSLIGINANGYTGLTVDQLYKHIVKLGRFPKPWSQDINGYILHNDNSYVSAQPDKGKA